MGCTQSKIENEEAVARCKERKQWMKVAVSSRNAFAAAHSAYSVALKNTGAALSDYAQGEVPPSGHTSAAGASASSSSAQASVSASTSAAIQPPMEKLPPPPPPLPDFSSTPLQRSASMPDLPISKPKKKPHADASIREEDDDEDSASATATVPDDDLPSTTAADSSTAPPPPPPSQPPRSTTPPPPPPPMPESKVWDYFIFGAEENMPPPTLSQPGETWPPQERMEIEEEKIKSPAIPPPPPAASNDIRRDEPPVTPPENVVAEPLPPKLVKKSKRGDSVHHQHAVSAKPSESKRGTMVAATVPPVNILRVLIELDDHFLKASESAHEVLKMLEATRMHYHSNFADNRGHIDHSARVMRVITWNRSIKGIPNPDDGKDDFDNDKWETHATILDKMLAWEKKLHDEVKAGEGIKIEYQRKVALLNKQKKHGLHSEALEKTKSAVSHLHTRYIVHMQSVDSTVSEINCLRGDKLYATLVDLVDGMAKMWETMHAHHGTQHEIVVNLRAFDISLAPKETSEQHHERTVQLWQIVRQWHLQFEKLTKSQKEYIKALNSWLRLNLIPIESSLKEKVSSPPQPSQPPIQALLHSWNDQLEKLPDELARNSIYSFSEVVRTIVVHQQDELKTKEKCEDLCKKFIRKKRAFDDWSYKYLERRAASGEEANPEGGRASNQDTLAERKLAIETLESRLKNEEEAYGKLCQQVREKSLGSLQTHLPELFRAVSDFALACSEMYKKLRSVTQSQNGA